MEENFISKFSNLNLSEMDVSELEDVTISLTKNFVSLHISLKSGQIDTVKFNEMLLVCIKHLKTACTKGSSFQNLILNTHGMLETLREILKSDESYEKDLKLKLFQLLANISVQNEKAQRKIWTEANEQLLEKLNESNDLGYVNVAAMMIYNMILSGIASEHKEEILKCALHQYDNLLKSQLPTLPDFVHILLDHFICTDEESIELYDKLNRELQKVFLCYVHDYVENETNDLIKEELLKHLTLEFKKKSDCVLKTVGSYVESIDPEIVVILLDIIASTTIQEKYLNLLKDDSALFLNIGCLLQALHKLGKDSTNAFTPIQKLEVLVPTSKESADFEKEISFSFKSRLVKSIANLSYRNKRNQELAREMEIMQSVFECSNADARNPLIKEWSILAIRNLCENNQENQEIVAKLTRVGDAANPTLKEFGLDDGVFRIKKT